MGLRITYIKEELMVPITKTVTVDLSSGTVNVNLGFVPDFFNLMDATAASTAQGVPGGDQVEIVSAGGTNGVTGGVAAYNGTDFAGVTVDPAVFTDIGSTGCILSVSRGEG